jgi:hypothetical protein
MSGAIPLYPICFHGMRRDIFNFNLFPLAAKKVRLNFRVFCVVVAAIGCINPVRKPLARERELSSTSDNFPFNTAI